MSNTNINSNKGFYFGLISIGLIFTFIITNIILGLTTVGSFSLIALGMTSITGFTFSIKGLREPGSKKKTIGILINLGFLLFFLAMIIANVIDILKFFDSN